MRVTLPAARGRRFAPFIALSALALSLSVLAGCAGGASADDAIGVNALTADPQAFSGEIAVVGVVQDVSADSSAITLIDLTEYETCGLTPCGGAGILPLFLPTSGTPAPSGALYEGSLPALEDQVVVTGTIRSAESGLYFDVERVDRGSATLMTKQR